MRKLSYSIILIALFCSIPAEATYRIGEAELTPRASVTEVYDDNVTYSSLNEIDDLISKLGLGADLVYEGKTRKLTFSGDIRHELFLDNGTFDNTAGEFDVVYAMELGAYDRLNLSNEFSRSEEPRSFEDAFGRTSGRYAYTRNTALASYEHDFSSQWTARGFYANSINDASTDLVTDSMLHNAGMDVIRTFSTKLSLIGSYEFLNRSFDEGPDAFTHGAALGARYAITEKLIADGRVGVDFIESFDSRDFEKPQFTASLTHLQDERTRFAVRFSKRFDTTTYTTDLFDQWRVSGTYVREISRRWRMTLDAFLGEGEYTGVAGRTDDLYGAGGTLGYDLSEKARVTVGYRYSETDSTIDTSDYSKNTLTAALNYLF